MKIKLLFSFILVFLLPINAIGQNRIQARIDDLILKYLPQSSEVGISIYNLSKDSAVYQYNADKLMRPASTLKLITAVTALHNKVKPFTTELWYNGHINDSILNGDLYIVGGLDPEFSDSEMDEFVSSITSLGIKKIDGNIYGDISSKDSLYWGKGWAWDDNPASFQPYISPLMYCKGKLKVIAKPSKPSEVAEIKVVPKSNYYTLNNQSYSHQKKAGKFEVSRNWIDNKNEINISGNVDRYRFKEINLFNSTDFFLFAFCEKLQEKGVTICGGYGVKNKTQESKPILTVSTPIQKVIENMLKNSDNLNAEALLFQLAQLTCTKDCSTNEGLQYIDSLIVSLNEDPKSYEIADGSGLSPYNLISPNLLLKFLLFAYTNKQIADSFISSLPIAGVDGTLRFRMKKGPASKKVKAKTGTVTAVSSLAGYTTNSKGDVIAFVILNQNLIKTSSARIFQDNICHLLSE